MSTALLKRLGQLAFVVLATAVLNFVLLKSLPGDLVDVIATESGSVTPAYLAELRHAYGLDQGVPLQLLHYLQRLSQLDMGFSFRYGEPVFGLIVSRLGATLALIGTGLAVSVVAGVALGIACARRPYGWVDTTISALATLGYSAPTFWTALMLIVAFGIKLAWLPIGGMHDIGAGHTGWAAALDGARHLVLPASTIAIYYVAVYARLMRASMIETLQEDYIRTARAKGNLPGRVIRRHALRNAILPVLTMLGLQASALIGGAVVVETVFGWPGLGQLSFEAIGSRDVNVLLGILLFSSALVVLLNIAVDLLQGWLDPRTRRRDSRRRAPAFDAAGAVLP